MKKQITATATLLAATTLIGAHSGAYAHNLDVEEQNIDRTGEYNEYGQEIVESRAKPWRDRDGDSSFNNPHQLKFPVSDSQAIFGWLDFGDVDVYEASTSLPGPSYEPDFVVAAPLPAACQTTKNQSHKVKDLQVQSHQIFQFSLSFFIFFIFTHFHSFSLHFHFIFFSLCSNWSSHQNTPSLNRKTSSLLVFKLEFPSEHSITAQEHNLQFLE